MVYIIGLLNYFIVYLENDFVYFGVNFILAFPHLKVYEYVLGVCVSVICIHVL